eukprot:g75537.t1
MEEAIESASPVPPPAVIRGDVLAVMIFGRRDRRFCSSILCPKLNGSWPKLPLAFPLDTNGKYSLGDCTAHCQDDHETSDMEVN